GLGGHGSRVQRRVSALMSVWPLSMRLAPPPVPRKVAMLWRRPGSISCRSTSYPRPRKNFSRNRATGVSSVLKLGIRMSSPASSTSTRGSTCASTARVESSIARLRSRSGSDEGERLDVGFPAREAAEVERAGVHRHGAAVREHLGHELAGDRAVHEAVAAEAGDDVKAGDAGHRADDAGLVGRHLVEAGL